jgi:head-tail adaptor
MTPALTRPLVLEAPGRVADGAGGFTETWEARGVVWAEVLAGTGRERNGAELAVALTPYRITVRAAPVGSGARPRADERFRDGARVFRILTVAERDPGGRYLICTAREEVSG